MQRSRSVAVMAVSGGGDGELRPRSKGREWFFPSPMKAFRQSKILVPSIMPHCGAITEVCREWESTALKVNGDVRVALIRIGVVLGKDGGALASPTLPPPSIVFSSVPPATVGNMPHFWHLVTATTRRARQEECDPSHVSMHATWNTWPHCGSTWTSSSAANSARQIAHSDDATHLLLSPSPELSLPP